MIKGLLFTAAFCCLSFAGRAGNWPQWRGPNFNGSAEETGLPTTWSQTENVVWKTPLPGQSGSTPIVWGKSIFLNTPDEQKNLNLICLDRSSGKIRWQKTVGYGDKSKGNNNMASPSAVTDGKSVFSLFGTSDLAAFDFDGNEIWRRNLGKEYGKFAIMWIYGSSPVLFQGRLYVQVLQRNPVPPDYTNANDGKEERESYILCIDPATGKDIWRHVRPSDALKESQEAYTTPIPYKQGETWNLAVLGGNCLTAHSLADGKELWRSCVFNSRNDPWFRIVPSPVAGDGMIFASAPKREPLFAIKTGGSGDVTGSAVAWSFKENPTDWSTPLYYKNRLFVLDGDKKVLTCLDPKTGEKKWQGNLGVREILWASPTGADNKIYCVSENGTVVVVDAGDEFKILATNKIDEGPVRSTLAIAEGQLFLRTTQNLYCIGHP
jgi:outer membrane protein assembly factor BamB